jgi:hypothetical protein
MKSSLRRNVLSVVGLYAVSLVAAMGCPARNESPISTERQSTAIPASIPAKSHDTGEATTVEVAEGYGRAPESTAKPKFDPIKVNGQFFVDWPKPQLAILVTGRQDGYLEPCGCAGLENQKGGLSRRQTLVEQLKEEGWPLVAVDVGNLVRRFGKQAEIQFAITVEALKAMGYIAAGFGPDDLRLSAGEVAAAIAGTEPGKSLFVSANVSVFGLTPKVQIVEKNGLKIGITAVMGDTYQKQVNNAEIEFTPAADALGEVAHELADCNVRILLANATVEESIELAKMYPDFDFVVTAEGGDEPPNVPQEIEGTHTKLIEVGHKGMFAVVLGIYDDPKQPLRYQRVALDSRYAASAEMQQLMATYQEQLHDLGWEGLGIRPISHPRKQSGVKRADEFAGSETCKSCHEKAFAVWEKSAHGHATDTLAKLNPPRHFDAECISCHVTGWNPQEYFPYATGYVSLEETPALKQNGCENCHGPAAAHAAVEAGELDVTADEEQSLRTALHRTVVANEGNKDGQVFGEAVKACMQCHDLDNSPEFDFQKYWPEVDHHGMD